MSIQKSAKAWDILWPAPKKLSYQRAKKEFKSRKMRVSCKKIAVGDKVSLRNGLTGVVTNAELIGNQYVITSTVHPAQKNLRYFDWYKRDGKSTIHKALDIVYHFAKQQEELPA